MKKTIIISALALLTCSGVYADWTKSIAKSERELYTSGKEIAKVRGDFDKDGVTDLAIYDSKTLSIYFSNGYAKYILHDTYKVENEYADSRIIDVTVNDKGVLRIETEWTNDRGASGSDTYVARYQDNDFYLIGYDCTYNNPPTTYSFNLLTNRAVTVSGYVDDAKTKTMAIKKLPLKKLSEVKIGEYKCDDHYEY
ncbi:MAG: hypothetical protein II129_04865 [Paludibacteraceae bacterium]|nr:hypothetical protein [Paludibacteraceae bacterium]